MFGSFFGRIRAKTVEPTPGVGLNLDLGTFLRLLTHQMAIQHREFSAAGLDDDGFVGLGDDLALHRTRIDVEAQRRFVWLVIVDAELETTDIKKLQLTRLIQSG